MTQQTTPSPALSNQEAEQALLGALFVKNALYDKVSALVRAEHFFSAVHGRIFEAIVAAIERGEEAGPVLIGPRFAADPDLAAVGGAAYLTDLMVGVPSLVAVPDYARAIRACYLRRRVVELAEDAIARASDPGEPVEETIGVVEATASDLGTEETTSRIYNAAEVTAAAVDAIQQAARTRETPGLSTGVRDLDRAISGLQPGSLCILAGRPAMGKSSVAMNSMALATARAGRPVLIFSLEMPAAQVGMRHLSVMTGIPTDDQQRGELTQAQWDAIVRAQVELGRLPIHVDETPSASLSHIRETARRFRRQGRCDLVIVDHIQIMPGGRSRAENRTRELGEITGGLKRLAKELDIPVVALSQLSRAVEQREDKRPLLSDLRESGSVEQDADVVCFVYREEYYLERSEPKQRPGEDGDKFADRLSTWQGRLRDAASIMEFIVSKNRYGRSGTVQAYWDGQRTLATDLARGRE